MVSPFANVFVCTETVTVFFLLPDFTVIFAVPFFFAVITPLLDTAATFLFEEENFIFCWVVSGAIEVLRVYLPPLSSVSLLVLTETFVVFTVPFCTFTFAVAFFPLFSVTVSFAVPLLFLAFILPFLSTVKIFLLLLL